jgi:hypothetical protein
MFETESGTAMWAWATIVLVYVASIVCAIALHYREAEIALYVTRHGLVPSQVLSLCVMLVTIAGSTAAITFGLAYWQVREMRRALHPSLTKESQLPQALAVSCCFLLAIVPFAIASL